MPLSIGIGISPTKISDAVSALFSGIPTPTWAIDFARDPYASLHPAFSHVRATESTLIQRYDGSYVQMLPNEFGLDGGRRVENIVPASEDFSTAAGWGHLINGTGTAPVLTPGQSDPFGGTRATRVQFSRAGAGYSLIQWAWDPPDLTDRIGSLWVRSRNGGTQTVYFRVQGNGAAVPIGPTWTRISDLTPKATASLSHITIGTRDIVGSGLDLDVDIFGAMLTPARSGQTEPDPEYISNGVPIGLLDEQVTNGDFSDGLTGWTDGSTNTGSLSLSGSEALLDGGVGGAARLQQPLSTKAGRKYRVAFSANFSGTAPYFYVGTSQLQADVLSGQTISNGQNSFEFTAVSGTSWIQWYVGPSTVVTIDNASTKEIRYHGYGVDGVAWFTSGPNGEDLTDPASGFPVLCTGLATRQQATNLWPYANGTKSDIAITSAGITDAAGFAGLENALAYDNSSHNAYAIESLLLTGNHVIQAVVKMDDGGAPVPATGITDAAGDIVINAQSSYMTPTVEALGNGLYLVWASKVGSGSAGNWGIGKYTGNSARGFKTLLIQVHAGTEPKPFVLTDGLSVTVDGDAFPHDITEIGGTAGTWIVEHTPTQSPAVESGNQTLLDLYADANNRARVYNPSGNLGVQVTDGGVSQWSASDAGANWTAGTLQRLAVRFETDDGSLVTDGDERLSDASMSVPDATVAYIGGDASSEYSGSIARIAYYGGA